MNTQLSKSNTETPRTQRLTEKSFRIFLCASLRSLQLGVAILFLVFVNFAIAKAASTNDITSLVQRGLFEEEANHNLDAAMQSYESAIKLHDKDRKLAATAVFRLGECCRKQGKTNEANAYYQRILTEFPDQTQLADLSKNYLPQPIEDNPQAIAAYKIGRKYDALLRALTQAQQTEKQASAIYTDNNPVLKDAKAKRAQAQKDLDQLLSDHPELRSQSQNLHGYQAASQLQSMFAYGNGADLQDLYNKQRELSVEISKAEALWNHVAHLKSRKFFGASTNNEELAKFFTTIQPDQLMIDLVNKRFEETQKLDKLGTSLGPQHPEYVQQQQNVKTVEKQIAERADALVWSIEQKYKMLKEQEDSFKQRLDAVATQTNHSVENVTEAPPPQLTTAEEDEQIRKIKGMIQNSPDLINVAVNSNEGTPLQQACIKGHLKVAEFLLANGANINVRTDKVSPPLICAAVHGHKALIDLLLSKGADIEAKSTDVYYNQTALMCASFRGFKNLALTLLAHGADINAIDSTGRTALHRAAEDGFPEIAELLLTNKARVDATTFEKKTPLHLACDRNHLDVVKVLLDHRADVNAKSEGGFTPLLDATQNDHFDVAQFLLEHGANTEDAVSDTAKHAEVRGCRPINFAIYRNDMRMLQLLLEHHADPNPRYRDTRWTEPGRSSLREGATALVQAIRSGDNAEAMAAMLLDHGADLKMRDEYGRTALQIAVETEKLSLVKLLVSHHADVNAMDNFGRPPIAPVIGAPSGSTKGEIYALLVKAGADPEYARARIIAIGREQNDTLSIQKLFTRSTNGFHEFTLLEALSYLYEANPRNAGYHKGRNGPYFDTSQYKDYRFPDFAHIVIHRLGDHRAKSEIKVNADEILKSSDCGKNVPLHWGDQVELPETDHPIDEKWEGLTFEQQDALRKCLQRTVTVKIKGSTTNLTICPPLPKYVYPEGSNRFFHGEAPAELQGVLVSYCWLGDVLTGSGVLLASSDLSRIKIIRPKQSKELIYNLASKDQSDPNQMPWLENGDIIEIPERTTTSQ